MIYLFLAEGFEEVEALAPLDILRRAGLSVTTVGVGGQVVNGAHGIPVTADITEGELSLDAPIEAVILPGGLPGTTHLDACPTVHKVLDLAVTSGAVIAAICAAPSILGKRGDLNGKHATCYPGFEGTLRGYLPTDKKVVRDGQLITAAGMGVAIPFGLALAEALASPEKAAAIAQGILLD